MARPTIAERFWTNVTKTDGCWLWTGAKTGGYGRIRINGAMVYAHRASFTWAHGPIPDGLCVMHQCDTPACVNPSHLCAGTMADNNADRDAKGRGVIPVGEAHGRSKLTADAVRAIRADGRPQRDIARSHNISQTCVSEVVSRKTWQHV